MYQRFISRAVAALLIRSGSTAFAQCGCNSPPVYSSVAPYVLNLLCSAGS